MQTYYIHNGKHEEGPFTLEDLKEMDITRSTLIWYEEIDEWTNAGEIEELSSLFSKKPPPLNRDTKMSVLDNLNANLASSGSFPTYDEEYETQTTNTGKNVFIISILGIIAISTVIVYFIFSKNNTNTDRADITLPTLDSISVVEEVTPMSTTAEPISIVGNKASVEDLEKLKPKRYLSVDVDANKNFWGNKIKIKGHIINSATVASYKDIIVLVTHLSKTGSAIEQREYTIYEIVGPLSKKGFELKIDNVKHSKGVDVQLVDGIGL